MDFLEKLANTYYDKGRDIDNLGSRGSAMQRLDHRMDPTNNSLRVRPTGEYAKEPSNNDVQKYYSSLENSFNNNYFNQDPEKFRAMSESDKANMIRNMIMLQAKMNRPGASDTQRFDPAFARALARFVTTQEELRPDHDGMVRALMNYGYDPSGRYSR